MSKASLWQHPYVNVFKHLNIGEWRKSTKEGEVMSVMDKSLKCTVYRITGSIPAGNYIQLPRTSSQSLGLTGRFLYLLFKPIAGKYFVTHIDVTTHDGLVVRLSFSNLFKEFKSTSTWLQFPYICPAGKGSVERITSKSVRKDLHGPAPSSSKWTLLVLDLQYILSMYLNCKYKYVKSVRLCANMYVKNVFTSDMQYEPDISLQDARDMGLLVQGIAPLPREMSFRVAKGERWADHYDYIRFPSVGSKVPFDSVQLNNSGHVTRSTIQVPGHVSPQRVSPKQVSVSRDADSQSSLSHSTSAVKQKKKRSTKAVSMSLPEVGVSGELSVLQGSQGEVHVFAQPEDDITVHRHDDKTGMTLSTRISKPSSKHSSKASSKPHRDEIYNSLQPDPIISLKKIIGFGGVTTDEILWDHHGNHVVYPCHAVIVSMGVSDGLQRFFIGHTDEVSCLALSSSGTLLASGQTGQQAVVRVWHYQSGEGLAMFKAHTHSIFTLSFSGNGTSLCGVGKDGHGKNMVVVWNTSRVHRRGDVPVIAKAHTDVDIVRMRVSPYDETKMISCGRDNVRVWRVRNGSLRSAPVNLGQVTVAEFTDVCFEAPSTPGMEPADKVAYASTRSGHIFEVDYARVCVAHIRRLLPVGKHVKEKGTFRTGAGIAINAMSVNSAFCVTGSEDGVLRIWPLDFKSVFMEAEHEGPVTAVSISPDGLRILAGTATGNFGVLDVSSRKYTTLMRSHVSRILAVALDPLRRQMATVSDDHTIRIWDLDTLQQLYDFHAPKDTPCTIAYHPSLYCVACGFDNGLVRIFSISSTSLVAELSDLKGKVTGLLYSPDDRHLYSASSLGMLALYDVSDDSYSTIRILGNMVAKGDAYCPSALSLSPDGRRLAFIGPSEFTVTVADARTLDEVLRIDISSITADRETSGLDMARRVHFPPAKTKQLLVATSENNLLRLDANNGRLINKVSSIHRSGLTGLDVCEDCRHMATAGDKVIKVWDYHMRLDLNFQVFIGHSDVIRQVLFTPDGMNVVSVGDAIFIWDFYGSSQVPSTLSETVTGALKASRGTTPKRPKTLDLNGSLLPRHQAPKPATPTQLTDISSIRERDGGRYESGEEVLIGPDLESRSDMSSDEEVTLIPETLGSSQRTRTHRRPSPGPSHAEGPEGVFSMETMKSEMTTISKETTSHDSPRCYSHFVAKPNKSQLAQRRYIAPSNQAGLELKRVLGYNGNGRGNVIWHPDSGLFAYTCGSIIVLEDLDNSSQTHLLGHMEEIAVLALQNDAQILASASGANGLTSSQICLWDLQGALCRKTLSYHEHGIVGLAYSRDDRFLVSVGDYRDCSIVVWSTQDYSILAASKTALPVHSLLWDPYTSNEFTSVGEKGTILFWLLDESQGRVNLNVHEAQVPQELMDHRNVILDDVAFTSAAYGGDNILYVGSTTGVLSAWDTKHNSCFMHWDADTAEIGVIVTKFGSVRLITGGASRLLRLWSVHGMGELRLTAGYTNSGVGQGLVMEDEMALDGAITSARFDHTMDVGVVSTSEGTLWYINWIERTSIRLVSSHTAKVTDIAFSENDLFATCCHDGSLNIYSLADMERSIQFQVLDQSCNCIAFSPRRFDLPSQTPSSSASTVVAGYRDGTVRLFDLVSCEMTIKMQPHAHSVTAIAFSVDGHVILSGSHNGLIVISNPTTGMTMRVIQDHKGAPITDIQVHQELDTSDPSYHALHKWLAVSGDRRVSVWRASWAKDFCEMVDWLTYPAPAFTPDGAPIEKSDPNRYDLLPPSLARFSASDPNVIVYVGYGMQKQVLFYNLAQKKVLRSAALTHWSTSFDLNPRGHLIAIATQERLVKAMDYHECSFQDFVAHGDAVDLVRFSMDGEQLFSVSGTEILLWDVAV
ncbi:WD repeat-containing protein 90-like isoform X2 [Lytechinus pictus]|uniref:WD repeat-containing protein 90-like isoform X2 n=1 Tax=Lytechinus pictus TaxID=7653 RepID=UPI0030B9CB9E